MTVGQLQKALEGQPAHMDVFMKQTMDEFSLSLVEAVMVKEASFSEDPGGPVEGTDMVLLITDEYQEEELVHEDELPEMTKEEYSKWYEQSEIVDGVRMGPKFERIESQDDIFVDLFNSLKNISPNPSLEQATEVLSKFHISRK